MKTLIVIPARYASTRLPAKPLAKISGKEMLLRVWEIAQKVAAKFNDCEAVAAIDDARIEEFCNKNNIKYVMTDPDCPSGTDRVIEAVENMGVKPEFVVNLQGDNPLCPSWFVEALIAENNKDSSIEIATPVVRLKWNDLDTLRENKKATPFSGTTAVMNAKNDAMWFSKVIIPGIRKEDKLRQETEFSPVYRHPGLYGYKFDVLKKISKMPKGVYEAFEGLEQLRWIENGVKVRCVKVDYKGFDELAALSGVDTPEDVVRVENVLAKYGEI